MLVRRDQVELELDTSAPSGAQLSAIPYHTGPPEFSMFATFVAKILNSSSSY